MICVSLKQTEPEQCFQALRKIEFAEIRMDGMKMDAESVRDLFSSHSNLIATCRPGSLNSDKRKSLLLWAVKAGAAYVDIEIENPDTFINPLVREARSHACKVIISYHNYESTPVRVELQNIVSRCFSHGADIAKIACQVWSLRDNARLLGILDSDKSIVVVGMGQLGKVTRVLGPFLGSPFTYAYPEEGKETAEGQISHRRLVEIMKRMSDA